jgi:hypothetical protein
MLYWKQRTTSVEKASGFTKRPSRLVEAHWSSQELCEHCGGTITRRCRNRTKEPSMVIAKLMISSSRPDDSSTVLT